MAILGIAQCGHQKIWKRNTNLGAVKVFQAYTSPYFRTNMAYAKRFADRCVILLVKYAILVLYPDPVPTPFKEHLFYLKRLRNDAVHIEKRMNREMAKAFISGVLALG